MKGTTAYVLSNGYVDDSISGISGTLAGKNCTVKSITHDATNNLTEVVFEWTDNTGATRTSNMNVPDGLGVVSASIDANNHLILTLSDSSTIDTGAMPQAKVEVSKDSGNALVQKADGLFVSSTGVQVSADTGNILVTKADGLYVPITDISGKVDKVTGKGLSTVDFTDTNYVHTDNNYTTADKTAVGNIANKVDKVAGKGLSTNDYDNTEKGEVAKIKDKVDKAQGTSNAGKILVVGADGNVTLGEDKGSDVVTAWETTPVDTKVPSEKLVKDSIDGLDGSKINIDNSASTKTTIKASLDGISQDLTKKVDIGQGIANKGKALVVGDDGNVTCGTVATDSLTIVDKTQAQYDALTDAEKNDATKLYNITDADDLDLTNYAKKSELDAISSVVSGITKIKKIVTVMASSTTSQPVGSNEIVTIDLTSYGFTKVPKAFLVGTFVNTAMITVLTTTQMKVQLINVYSTARSDMKAQYHLIEFE